MEITVEVGCYKFPYAANLTGYWEENRPALLAYMEQVHRGLRGFVVEDTTGRPIANASIAIAGLEGKVVRSWTDGDYWRLLLPGEYHVTVTADGSVFIIKCKCNFQKNFSFSPTDI